MINKLNIFLIFFFLSITFVKSIIAEEFFFDTPEILVLENGNLLKSTKGGKVTTDNNIEIYAKKFEYDKINSILIATGNVKVFDIENQIETKSDKAIYNGNQEILTAKGNVNIVDKKINLILDADKTIYLKKKDIFQAFDNVNVDDQNNKVNLETNKLTYDRKKEKISSFGNTKIIIKEEYIVNTSDITLLRSENKIFSNQFTEMSDQNGNYYIAENFRYFINTKIFRGKSLYISTKEKDKYYFDDGMVDLAAKEIAGKDLTSFFNKNYDDNNENEPRLKGNVGLSDENKTTVYKGAFTTCKSRGDKCPPWVIEAREIEHDKNKKIVFYKDAWLKLYNVPVLYYPRFFHPDPTVDRQTGFLKPSASQSEILGSSLYLPYFYVLSESRDLTFKPRFFEDDKTILQTEYRSVTKNSYTITDFSYASGHKSYLDDDKDSRSHFFAKSSLDLDIDKFENSSLSLNLEKTTNDTYLKLFKLESPLLYDRDLSATNSGLTFSANKEDLNLTTSISIHEKLNGSNSDRYEYTLPDFSLSKTIDTLDYPGFLTFDSSGSHNIFDTNKSETRLINDLNYQSDSTIFNSGVKNDYNILFKNLNSLGKNSSNYESSLGQEFLTTLLFKSSLPMEKEGISYNDYLTPRAIIRYSPNDMSNKTNGGLDIGNVFATNRIGSSDTFEPGKSLTFGFEYNKQKNVDQLKVLSAKLGTIYRLNEEESLGSDNSMNKKQTDIVGNINLKPIDDNYLDYNFSMNNGLNTFNSHEVTLQTSVNNFITRWNYIENFVGNSEIHSINFDANYEFDKFNSIGFNTNRNININFTEYYDTYYQYQNDCLTAKIAYNKSFYEDRDIKPSETLFFSLRIIPLGGYDSRNLLGGY